MDRSQNYRRISKNIRSLYRYRKNIENKAILKAYVSIDYLDNENELKYFNSNIETIYAVKEDNRVLNHYIDAVTAQKEENEEYIEHYKITLHKL